VLRDRHRLERPVAIARHLDLDVADLGRDRLRIGAVAAVPRTAASRVVGFVAQMVSQLTSRPVCRTWRTMLVNRPFSQVRSKPSARARATSSSAQSPHLRRRLNQRRQVPLRRHQRLRVRRSTCSHQGDPPQPTAISRGPSDHARYTKFLTDPSRHQATDPQ
jgi:hypothetical protein